MVVLYVLFIVLFFTKKTVPTKHWYYTGDAKDTAALNVTTTDKTNVGPIIEGLDSDDSGTL